MKVVLRREKIQMALDAGMLNCIVREIQDLNQSRIEKIHQPSQDEFVIILHSAKTKARILINVGSNNPRINLTQSTQENPQKAPMLCMLLRMVFITPQQFWNGLIMFISSPI